MKVTVQEISGGSVKPKAISFHILACFMLYKECPIYQRSEHPSSGLPAEQWRSYRERCWQLNDKMKHPVLYFLLLLYFGYLHFMNPKCWLSHWIQNGVTMDIKEIIQVPTLS
jgi:hypothetical protein